jgi:hypothetical protein
MVRTVDGRTVCSAGARSNRPTAVSVVAGGRSLFAWVTPLGVVIEVGHVHVGKRDEVLAADTEFVDLVLLGHGGEQL